MLFVLPFMVLPGKAQSNLVFYFANDQFNASFLNPANASGAKFSFSIFPLSGTNIEISNQGILRELIDALRQNSAEDEVLKDAFRSIIKGDLFYQRLESSLLNIGYTSEFGSFHFGIKENVLFMGTFKSDFSSFLMSTSLQSVGINQPQAFPIEAMHYREYSLAFSRELIRNKLTIGARGKLYFGKSSFYSEVQGEIVESDNHFYLQTYGLMRLSGPIDRVTENGLLLRLSLAGDFTAPDYLLNAGNPGIGLDLGLNYTPAPRLRLSASITDIGRINWKSNPYTMQVDGKYKFSDLSVTQTVSPGGQAILVKNYVDVSLSDSISHLLQLKIDSLSYTKALPATLYAGLQYRISPTLSVGLADSYTRAKNMGYNNILCSVNWKMSQAFSVTTGYSIIGKTYANLPLAIQYNWDSGQSYIGTNNFLSFLDPSGSGFTGLSFGTSFYLFWNAKKYKKQNEYLPYFKEKRAKSRTSKGLIFNNSPES